MSKVLFNKRKPGIYFPVTLEILTLETRSADLKMLKTSDLRR